MRSFLGKIEYGRLQEAVEVYAAVNPIPHREIYTSLLFSENELYRVVEANVESGEQSAWLIKNIVTWPWKSFQDKTTGINQIESAAAEALKERKLRFPEEFLLCVFVRREQFKGLQAMYYLHPPGTDDSPAELEGLGWSNSDFAPKNIRAYPQKFAYFREVVVWGERWWPRIKESFMTFDIEGF